LEELRAALSVELNTHWAKNVVLFVADGMGPATQTAARVYAHGKEGHLAWERFPHMGLLKVIFEYKSTSPH
jgi:alkaline phosphatase